MIMNMQSNQESNQNSLNHHCCAFAPQLVSLGNLNPWNIMALFPSSSVSPQRTRQSLRTCVVLCFFPGFVKGWKGKGERWVSSVWVSCRENWLCGGVRAVCCSWRDSNALILWVLVSLLISQSGFHTDCKPGKILASWILKRYWFWQTSVKLPASLGKCVGLILRAAETSSSIGSSTVLQTRPGLSSDSPHWVCWGLSTLGNVPGSHI